MAALARDGAEALAGLRVQPDPARNVAWYRSDVTSSGSTAYLYLGKLGDGASTLRLVVRYDTPRGVDLSRCVALVDGKEVGAFVPAPDSYEKSPDGSVLQVADIHFDDVRPVVLAMVRGQSAIVRAGDGSEIRLDRSALEEMRAVLSAYLHLQGQP